MNEILKKCTLELAKDTPDISYVRGMLDTLLSMNTVEITPVSMPPKPLAVVQTPTMDEAATLDATARAALQVIEATTEIQ